MATWEYDDPSSGCGPITVMVGSDEMDRYDLVQDIANALENSGQGAATAFIVGCMFQGYRLDRAGVLQVAAAFATVTEVTPP
jgi:hypothetical protein